MSQTETSINSSAPEPQMGQTKSAGSSSHSMVKTQLLQAYFFMVITPYDWQLLHRPVKVSWQACTWQPVCFSASALSSVGTWS